MNKLENIHLQNHYNNLLTGTNNLKNDETFCDVKILCGSKIFSAHRIILTIHSEYFSTILKAASFCQCPVIVLNDLSEAQMSLVLQFIYQGEVNVPNTGVKSFIEAASYLKVKGYNGIEVVAEREHKDCMGLAGSAIPVKNNNTSVKMNQGCRNENVSAVEAEPRLFKIQIGEPKLSMVTDLSSVSQTAEVSLKCKRVKGIKNKCLKLQRAASLCCPYCEKRFRSASHCKEHARKHTGERPFTCAVCRAAFRHSKSLARHRNTQHPPAPGFAGGTHIQPE